MARDHAQRLERLVAAPARLGAAAAEREHRHRQAKPGGEDGAIGGDVAGDRAVVREAGGERARAAVATHVLVDVGRGDGAALPAEGVEKPPQVRALAPLDQRLRQRRRHVEGVMPAAAALREVRADAGNRDVEQGQRTDPIGCCARHRECRRPAPVVADQMEALEPEPIRELEQVRGEALLGVAVGRRRAVAEAGQVGHDQAMVRRQQRHHLAPLVPCLRPAVQQDHRIAGAAGSDMQRQAREGLRSMLDLHAPV
jgi:hypothetical protein